MMAFDVISTESEHSPYKDKKHLIVSSSSENRTRGNSDFIDEEDG